MNATSMKSTGKTNLKTSKTFANKIRRAGKKVAMPSSMLTMENVLEEDEDEEL